MNELLYSIINPPTITTPFHALIFFAMSSVIILATFVISMCETSGGREALEETRRIAFAQIILVAFMTWLLLLVCGP
jgi:hypothetical protein